MSDMISAEQELDLTKEGFSLPMSTWAITKAEIEEPSADKSRAVVTFEAEVDGLRYEVTDRFWLKHPNPKAENAGKSGLKRLFNAAFGEPRGSVVGLVGRYVKAEGVEDEQGFRRLKKLGSAS